MSKVQCLSSGTKLLIAAHRLNLDEEMWDELSNSQQELAMTFDAQRFYGTGGASLYGLILFHELRLESAAVGLKRLANLVAAGQLRPHIDLEADWTQIADVAQKLLDRHFPGKAVLHVTN